jgi:hypothetical protein
VNAKSKRMRGGNEKKKLRDWKGKKKTKKELRKK